MTQTKNNPNNDSNTDEVTVIKVPSVAQIVFDTLFYNGEGFIIKKSLVLGAESLISIRKNTPLEEIIKTLAIMKLRDSSKYEISERYRFISDHSELTLVTIKSPYSTHGVEYGVVCGDFYYSSKNILYPLIN